MAERRGILSAVDVLVTGGAGFVGSRLVAELAREGHRVVVLDNLSAAGGWRLLGPEHPLVERHHGDIRVPDDLSRLPERRWDRVYHLAASFANARSIAHPVLDETTNVGGTLHVLRHAIERGCGLFVYAGSSSSYGDVATPFQEDGPAAPGTPYARTKLAGEDLVRRSALPHVIVRLFNVYGPGDLPGPWRNAIPNMIAALHDPDGRITLFGDDATRDFTYVEDVVRVLSGCAPLEGRTVNVATGREVRVRDVAESIARVVDTSRDRIVVGPRREWDRVVHRVADVARLRSLLGWTPSTPLTDGLAATVAWLRGEGLVGRSR